MDAAMEAGTLRTDYRLADNLTAPSGQVFLSGTQALVRLVLEQARRDRAAGLGTAGFVSGYRGSPLGMVDQAMWKAAPLLDAAGVRFLPAINEELAATAVLGTQQVEGDPQRTVDAVFSLWYGKGPGVDRAGDALKHGNAYGSSPHGGVLVVAGDDHGCVSSSMSHQSDFAMQAWSMPVLAPADVAEYLEFGLYGWALSRYSGNWVGFTALSETVESAMTVDLDQVDARVACWQDADAIRRATGHVPPPDGLHYRWPDLPSPRIEQRLGAKLEAVRAFARVNSIDRMVVQADEARAGIVTCGKAHHDLMEVFRRLGISTQALADAGIRVYKLGLACPVEPTRLLAFARGLEEILVVEEKGPLVERQLQALFYNAPDGVRPAIAGKLGIDGRPLLPEREEMRPSRLMQPVADWLARLSRGLDRRELVPQFSEHPLLSNAADGIRRQPYFCPGCPHNTSTRVPEGSRAQAGIGCHFMASWMDRQTSGLIQMGGEGVDWVAHSRFTAAPHVFQNLGDGTYYHSGYLAIRQAVAARTNVTYKILCNDAVAMTGGQPVDGPLDVEAIARQVSAEGVARVALVSDRIDVHRGRRARFPSGTTFHPRESLDAVQRELREVPGVTVLLYEQACAAELRRRRKVGRAPAPARHVFINEAVCEGCGDCSVQSNCLAVQPIETALGRKRQIDQASCNHDESCIKGFCPSFVTVEGAAPRHPVGHERGVAALRERAAALREPAPRLGPGPFDILVAGVGGTGVVTVGALIAMAAHLERRVASVLDFMGFAQKGGSVLSFVRLAQGRQWLNQARIDAQQADAVLACDLAVGASPDVLQTVAPRRTQIVANTHPTPVAEFQRNPDSDLHADALLAKLRHATGSGGIDTLDAQALATAFLGDTVAANIVVLGFAWQKGLVPVSLAALTRAIELNGVAVDANLEALALGRLAAGDPLALTRLAAGEGRPDGLTLVAPEPAAMSATPLPQLVADRVALLTAYQDAAYAARYTALVEAVQAAENALGEAGRERRLTRAVAEQFARLMAYKDEYEVARLHSDPAFRQALRERFDGPLRLRFHLAPPLLSRPGKHGEPPRKIAFGAWLWPLMGWLAKGKRLRGTRFDPFGRTAERRLERQSIADYEARIRALLPALTEARLPIAVEIAQLPAKVRGFGHIKLAAHAVAAARAAELLHRFDAQRYPRPDSTHGANGAGQLRGIPIRQVDARADAKADAKTARTGAPH
ncbi:indolepyruvate ferredoxin oxidoreductase family protein [Cupriavidus gilardii]|uniref:Indolepyruvate ferredoxin oxidoreductase family protein n=1 Tax=Cupriavidus gilardii TaxID=82541 RepID=A0ABY4VXK3_9BURK|nr:indolepyruvate ferredoxin oxidoreductase family protein [Cupriavidus gilardii]USE80586.1 indolepyruvate ferredoxin oxidoreductase family protein [Cupriavidus gilardii]